MRRFSLLLFCALSCAAATVANAGGIAFVINSGSATISVIDMTTLKEVQRIPTLREPHHLVLSPDGRSLLVGDTAGNQMMFLDPRYGGQSNDVPRSEYRRGPAAHAGDRSLSDGIQPGREVPGRERPAAQPG
jgi:YVTN family beta-propeller protein